MAAEGKALRKREAAAPQGECREGSRGRRRDLLKAGGGLMLVGGGEPLTSEALQGLLPQ